MRAITAMNVLLRTRAELPAGMTVRTEEFREGWNFVRTRDVNGLEKKIRTRGWNFIKIADGSLRSGVGETSQEAIASALRLALRRVSTHFNVAEVENIELTRYPWFFLARVRVYPYKIQQGAVLPVPDGAFLLPSTPHPKRLPANAAELFPNFASAMPILKEMLILSRGSHTGTQ
jgi:hypothetical protein